MIENLKALGKFPFKPAAGMSDLLDRGSLGSAVILALIATAILLAGLRPAVSGDALRYQYIQDYPGPLPPAVREMNPPPPVDQLLAEAYTETSFYTPALVIAVLVVPALILGGVWIAGLGSFRVQLDRDYGSLLTCCLMAWTAGCLPVGMLLLLTSAFSTPPGAVGGAGVAVLVFAVLTGVASQVVFGSEVPTALLIALIGFAAFCGGMWLAWNSRINLGFLLSPFILYLLFMVYQRSGSDLFQVGAGMRRRQSFKRYLEACTINPADSDAQYQLGLIYQQRRQLDEARPRFEQAVKIHPGETDAHFQLGRIAREQGRLAEALAHFQTVVDQNPKHSSHEVWREVGALHLAAGRADVARDELLMYTEQRPFDPEGLYYLGQTYESLGEQDKAAQSYRSAVESVKSAPPFRRSALSRWSRQAQKALKKVGT